MLFDLTMKIKAPGQSEADALERLRSRIPNWEIVVDEISLSENQPEPIAGDAAIMLPHSRVRAN